MLTEEDEITIQYPAPGEIRTSADDFTPIARRPTLERSLDRNLLEEERDSEDDGRPVRTSYLERMDRPLTTANLLENVDGLLRGRPTPMKPGRFDGTGSFESFLVQFEVCARHNRWTAVDKVDHLRCALEKAATQLLWDFGAQPNVTYEELDRKSVV